jgi:hypothetical protein
MLSKKDSTDRNDSVSHPQYRYVALKHTDTHEGLVSKVQNHHDIKSIFEFFRPLILPL